MPKYCGKGRIAWFSVCPAPKSLRKLAYGLKKPVASLPNPRFCKADCGVAVDTQLPELVVAVHGSRRTQPRFRKLGKRHNPRWRTP